MIKLCMMSHIYKFNNTIRKQSAGGPTRLDLTGELADIFMLWWDRTFVNMLADLGLLPELYTRFKDDTTILSDELPPGSMLHNGKLVVNH